MSGIGADLLEDCSMHVDRRRRKRGRRWLSDTTNVGARRVKETLCRGEREILALSPKTSPWQGPYSISAGWGAEFEGTPLSDVLCFLTARHCF